MPHKFYKYKLLLDEGFPLRSFFDRLNSRFNVRHIAADLKKEGLKDSDVYKTAAKDKRLVITYNAEDFKEFPEKDKNSGVIGVSANLSIDQIDKKLTSLLNKKRPSELYGKFLFISGET